MDALLEARNITVSYGERRVLDSFSFSFYKGKSYAIMGPSGAGKSTLIKALDALLPSSAVLSGEVLLEGEVIKDYSLIRGRRISYLMQDPVNAFNPVYTIGKQLERCQLLLNKHIDRKVLKGNAECALVAVGLDRDVYKLYPFQMSGGMLQRATLAIAYLEKADVILLDEPTSALDEEMQKLCLSLIDGFKESGSVVIYITHSLSVAMKSDVILLIEDGALYDSGSPNELINSSEKEFTRRFFS